MSDILDWECVNNGKRVFNIVAPTQAAALKRTAKIVRSFEDTTGYVEARVTLEPWEGQYLVTLLILTDSLS